MLTKVGTGRSSIEFVKKGSYNKIRNWMNL